MTHPIDRKIADIFPRRSGELIFEAEWEKRSFGMAVALVEQGFADFDDFRWRVVSAISMWERANPGNEGSFRFGERWLIALEKLLVDRGVVSRDEIERKIARRGAGNG